MPGDQIKMLSSYYSTTFSELLANDPEFASRLAECLALIRSLPESIISATTKSDLLGPAKATNQQAEGSVALTWVGQNDPRSGFVLGRCPSPDLVVDFAVANGVSIALTMALRCLYPPEQIALTAVFGGPTIRSAAVWPV